MSDTTREAWLARRRRGIGGSDIAAILGRSRWRTATQVYQDKRGEGEPQAETLAMRRGRALEPLVLEAYCEETGRTLMTLDSQEIRHATLSWAIGTLDAMTTDGRPVEAKTADYSRGWGEPGTDQIPEDYLLQVQWYMAVAASHWAQPMPEADVPVLIVSKLRIYVVRADAELHQIMFEAGARFWDCVQRGQPPDEAESYPLRLDGVDRVAVRADDRAMATCARLAELAPQLAQLEAEKDEARDYLRAYLGPATELVDPLGRTLATARPSKASTYVDTKALVAAYPDIAAKYTKTKATARPLLVK